MKKSLAAFAASLVVALVVAMAVALPTQAEDAAPKAQAQTQEVTLLAIGDDLIHENVYKAAKTKTGYNFDSLFAHVKSDVQAADIAVINQETIFTNSFLTGYPSFGSPSSLGNAIAKAGFDVVQHASNHTMDRGASAIDYTLKYWRTKHPEIKVLGIHKSAKAASRVTIVRRNGIKIAMLNYTYGLNGATLPSGRGYLVDLLSNKAKIKSDIKKAKKQADFVVVFGHMGTEYQYVPDATQKKWVKWFANHGVDLYVGTHPHVLEPVRWIKGSKGNRMLTYYSLGNFVSNQGRVDTQLGGMAQVTLVRAKSGVKIKSWKLTPLVTHKNKKGGRYTVYKLSDYTNKLAAKHIIHTKTSDTFTVKSLRRLFKKITGLKAS